MKRINFLMDEEEYDLMFECMIAEKTINTSDFIRKAISEYIKNHFDISYD